MRYTVGHAPGTDGDFVRLVVLDPSGERRISRDLPVGGESCATLAQAMALVVERYFRELETPALAVPESEPAVASENPSSPPPSVRPPSLAPRTETPPAPLTPQLMLGLGLGLSSAQPGALGGLQGGGWFRQQVHLELGVLADLAAHHQQVQSADLQLRSFPVQLSLGFGQRGQVWDFFAGPEVRWTLEVPHTNGLVGVSAPGAAFSVGLAAGTTFWQSSALGITLRGSLDYALAGTKFQIETGSGGSQQVLKLPAFQAISSIGVAFGSAP